MEPLLDLFADHWRILFAAVLLMTAVWLLLPGEGRKNHIVIGILTAIAVASGLGVMLEYDGSLLNKALFYMFAATSIGAGALMISSRNPVYAALWFALATLSVCGLFVLRSAPFLAAATVVVYAGAIIVTFLFVVMLASQTGRALYDQQASQPFSAAATGAILLFALLLVLTGDGKATVTAHVESVQKIRLSEPLKANSLSEATGDEPGTLRDIGRSLFGDYLFFVELAGTLLLAAAVGAIAIAPRRRREAI